MQPRRGVAVDPEPTLEERLPQAAVAGATGVEGTQLALDASASKPGDDDAAIASYTWDLDGDGTYTDAEGATPKVSFPDEGSYPVGVLVTDVSGRSATARADVNVTNAAPVITDARVDDAAPASFSARIADSGSATRVGEALLGRRDRGRDRAADRLERRLHGDGDPPGRVTSARLVVSDGDGGTRRSPRDRRCRSTRSRAPMTRRSRWSAARRRHRPSRPRSRRRPARVRGRRPAGQRVDHAARAVARSDRRRRDLHRRRRRRDRHVHLPRDRQSGPVARREGDGRGRQRPDQIDPVIERAGAPIEPPVATPRVSRPGSKPIDQAKVAAATHRALRRPARSSPSRRRASASAAASSRSGSSRATTRASSCASTASA